MLKAATSLSKPGLQDWLLQRISAVVVLLYTIFLLGIIIVLEPFTYVQWCALWQATAMRVFSLITLYSLLLHAWIGLWTIITDYIQGSGLRSLVQYVILGMLCLYFFWGIDIFWSVPCR